MVEEARLGLPARLWIYQAERLPLARTATLLAFFTASSINVSAALAGVPRPGLAAYLVAFLGAFVFFAQLRACDEIKDAEDDARWRPERPIPRGLVSLSTIVTIGAALSLVSIAAALAYWPPLLWPLALVWAWMALMTAEFFVPAWLKARPLAYLVSHMLIMPLIDLFVTACEWLPRASAPATGLWVFLLLSFVNGCILEIGRKIYAPESERPGVETYSREWGLERALAVWSACLNVSALLLVLVGWLLGAVGPVAIVTAVALYFALGSARAMARDKNAAAQKRLDLVAGLWVAFCYLTAGMTPLILGWLR